VPECKSKEEHARQRRADRDRKVARHADVELIAQCCNETAARFYIALAMLEKEAGTCRNVYEHDVGGALSGFPKPVTSLRMAGLHEGHRSNGVAPSQLTFKGFFTDMESKVSNRTTCTTTSRMESS
jgi:hypothetical protein